jgi:hypothetical protein
MPAGGFKDFPDLPSMHRKSDGRSAHNSEGLSASSAAYQWIVAIER